jgi:hypothetical protein
MPSEFLPDDPRNVWQNQTTEPLKMSADLMRYKAWQHHREAQRQSRAGIAAGLVLCALFALFTFRAHELLLRLGWSMVSLWCAWFAYHAHRWLRPGALMEDAPTGPSLEFYRRELERRATYGRHAWLRSGLPFCFLGLGIAIVPPLLRNPALTVNALPFFILLAVWLVSYLYLQAAGRKKLQHEIEELRAFERDAD